MPPLVTFALPAAIIDKTRYSAFAEPGLIEHLRQREADALIVSGSETDVCVLATVLDAVDMGFRVIIVRDAVCSSSDEGHEMLIRDYHTRCTEQIETADEEAILSRCRMTGVERQVVNICWRRQQPWPHQFGRTQCGNWTKPHEPWLSPIAGAEQAA